MRMIFLVDLLKRLLLTQMLYPLFFKEDPKPTTSFHEPGDAQMYKKASPYSNSIKTYYSQ